MVLLEILWGGQSELLDPQTNLNGQRKNKPDRILTFDTKAFTSQLAQSNNKV